MVAKAGFKGSIVLFHLKWYKHKIESISTRNIHKKGGSINQK